MTDEPPRLHAAVFLDRDGTLMADVHFVAHPEQVVLLPGAARAVARLNAAGLPVVVVTNQSGIGRGYYAMADYERVHERMTALLADAGAHVDAAYLCPHWNPDGPACACRKPGTLLHRTAARELALDLARCWYIGDRLRDVLPAAELGGTGVLVPGPCTPEAELAEAHARFAVAESLDTAVTRLLATR